ncbi:zinc-binding alcohol dehydrogenase family protein [Paraburkholderia sp. DHOC27]|uniref:zinc-binding alcohol dehydrogenase family protein n=1 Tax=Paraburkholderia sp. DHOC27 TaxID=2303330 RepID=UPI000E3E5D7B|nr:zinc-binding alcohol dehydrogenase family protein [Paraburkholderia sp. DHOC27]RFU45449.1 zinc-binding alcohol dehydrogenase family protein [Paraburkholderia sp. DHOC27]
MRAVGYEHAGPVDREEALIDLDLPEPIANGRDLLVEVKAVSVNPVDVLIRASAQPVAERFRVLGWDAAGIVRAVGPDVTLFQPGDEVAYSGTITRPGTNQERHLIDERLVGRKPRSLDWAEAAALPLTGVTAWEVLFDRLDINRPVAGCSPAILIIGGAGGVGSMAIQLARQLTNLTVIATASRPETRDWVAALGAHYVIDHTRPLKAQLDALGLGAPGFVFSTTHTDRHVLAIADLIAPEGRFALIDNPKTLDIVPFKQKSVSIHWELMYTRSLFDTLDMGLQGRILNRLADLADRGHLQSTLTQRLSPINAANLKRAHAMVEGGTMRGKVVLEGWS